MVLSLEDADTLRTFLREDCDRVQGITIPEESPRLSQRQRDSLPQIKVLLETSLSLDRQLDFLWYALLAVFGAVGVAAGVLGVYFFFPSVARFLPIASLSLSGYACSASSFVFIIGFALIIKRSWKGSIGNTVEYIFGKKKRIVRTLEEFSVENMAKTTNFSAKHKALTTEIYPTGMVFSDDDDDINGGEVIPVEGNPLSPPRKRQMQVSGLRRRRKRNAHQQLH